MTLLNGRHNFSYIAFTVVSRLLLVHGLLPHTNTLKGLSYDTLAQAALGTPDRLYNDLPASALWDHGADHGKLTDLFGDPQDWNSEDVDDFDIGAWHNYAALANSPIVSQSRVVPDQPSIAQGNFQLGKGERAPFIHEKIF